MPNRNALHAISFQKVLLTANLCLWVYFWIAFAQASYPFRPDPLGHPAGSGYTFWGHSIGVAESPFVHPFFRAVFYPGFPAFAVATSVVQVISPHLLLNGFLAGISGEGWLLLGIMALTFVQWSLIGWLGRKLWRRLSPHQTTPGGFVEGASHGGVGPATSRS
jgi:hypothetical protein